MAQNDYMDDVRKYASHIDENALNGIVNYLGKGVLSQRDAALVSCSDPEELKRVRDNFCKKKLGLTHSDAELDEILQGVCQMMKGDRSKSRVTFYYLLAEKAGKLGSLA